MLEFLKIRLAPTILLGILASLLLSYYLGLKLDEKNFESVTVYNLLIYSPYIVLALYFIIMLILIRFS